MPIYLDPRVIEGSLQPLDNDAKHNSIVLTINGLELSVLENRLKTMVEELKNLSVDFNTSQCDLEHSLTQHFHPLQFGGWACECPHTYFCSSGQTRSVMIQILTSTFSHFYLHSQLRIICLSFSPPHQPHQSFNLLTSNPTKDDSKHECIQTKAATTEVQGRLLKKPQYPLHPSCENFAFPQAPSPSMPLFYYISPTLTQHLYPLWYMPPMPYDP
jgi:hypothetical protein